MTVELAAPMQTYWARPIEGTTVIWWYRGAEKLTACQRLYTVVAKCWTMDYKTDSLAFGDVI